MEFILFPIIFGDVFVFIEGVNFCQERVLLFLVMKRALALALFKSMWSWHDIVFLK
jgi:hypothetical protein